MLAHADEFLSYNLLLQAYDTVRSSSSSGGEAAGWEKLLLLLRRALAALHDSITDTNVGSRCHVPPQTRLALRAVVALATENYMGFLRLLQQAGPTSSSGTAATATATTLANSPCAPVLLRCVLHRFLPFVRRRVLEVWSRTLFKKERVSLRELARLLCFDTPAQARAFAALHGVAIVETGGGGGGGDAWGDYDDSKANGGGAAAVAAAGGGGFIEPRLASVSSPSVGQTYDERRRQQKALCPRQDSLVLLLFDGQSDGGETLAALWESMGGL